MMKNEKRDVFISYHGGGNIEDETQSSYKMAEDLRIYLEQRGIACFLCKNENESDFYEAIEKGIKNSDHFILVACNKSNIEKSTWVREEIKQFDGLHKLGRKPNCLISACIFGSMTESDLIDINSMFSTKEVVKGREGFERLYQMICEKKGLVPKKQEIIKKEQATQTSQNLEKMTAEELSCVFLDDELKDHNSFSDEELLGFCENLTERLKCMTTGTISQDCKNIVEETYNNIISSILKNRCNKNVMKVIGPAGTQKSFVLQLLYLWFLKNYDAHNYEPVYIHCDIVRDIQNSNGEKAKVFFDNLSSILTIGAGRQPLFIVDGLLNIVVEDDPLDFATKRIIDNYNAYCIIGVNNVFEDNAARKTKCWLVTSKYSISMVLSPISLYDKEQCIRYIRTLSNLPVDNEEEVYDILNTSGLLTIDEFLIRKVLEWYEENKTPDLVDIFENDIINILNGDSNELKAGAKFVFNFAYKTDTLSFNEPLHKVMLRTISRSPVYLHCLMAIHFCNEIDEYFKTEDLSFFSMVWPKEVTRFITKKINKNANLESTIVRIAERYNDMTSLGQSEMSFLLGRIKSPNSKARAEILLEKYYNEKKECIKRKIIDDKYNNIPYSQTEYKQDLFLLRGISVSLIYCGNIGALYEYLRFLIDNDLANLINRGFHLEYYGDKRFLPGQDTLDYEDNPAIGQRTLRILCNSIENQLESRRERPAILLELFTIASLIQARIEIDRSKVSFPIVPYIKRFCDLSNRVMQRLSITDDTVDAFFKMATKDFEKYRDENMRYYSPKREMCNQYLSSKDVKRAGWVMQNIEDPESIMEHMYACWFIGLVYLPDTDEREREYNKQAILNMLIVHDLAETLLDDIPKYEKKNYLNYDEKENETMLSMLLKGTYQGMSTLDKYVEAWNSWYKRADINAMIAKDIDTLQAIYQFLLYYLKYPEKFSEERVVNWLREIREVKTEKGKEILQELILNNEIFLDVLDEYKEKF